MHVLTVVYIIRDLNVVTEVFAALLIRYQLTIIIINYQNPGNFRLFLTVLKWYNIMKYEPFQIKFFNEK